MRPMSGRWKRLRCPAFIQQISQRTKQTTEPTPVSCRSTRLGVVKLGTESTRQIAANTGSCENEATDFADFDGR
jgi:hypothetical protein